MGRCASHIKSVVLDVLLGEAEFVAPLSYSANRSVSHKPGSIVY